MQAAILGKKVGMTQVYDEQGVIHPVTVVQAGPCSIVQVRTTEADGYNALQLGFQDAKAKHVSKARIGHCAKAGVAAKRHLREIRLTDAPADDVKAGQEITVGIFKDIKLVDILGVSKGKGFQGGMKRHHFAGQCASHGTERKHRSPGSIASHATERGRSGKIKKGKRMAGHMGVVNCTLKNHRLVGIDEQNHLLLIQGSVPGSKGSLVLVRSAKTARQPQASV